MTTSVRLLGVPSIERDGTPARPPRGKKVWALLGYLASNDRALSRQHLAELLFGEAEDPLGSLRWTLAELRRALESPEALRGDPVRFDAAEVSVDLAAVTSGDESRLLDVGGAFLEGLYLDACPVFEAWLTVERYRWSAEQEARLRSAAEEAYARGAFAQAAQFAARAVAVNVLDQGHHELLIRSLVGCGDRTGALQQVAACEDVFRRELGRAPTPSLRSAADSPRPARMPGASDAVDAASQLEVGKAAVAVGATHSGLGALYQASALAELTTDRSLQARAFLELGSALVHAVRGRDGEGSTVLHRALHLATSIDDRVTAMTACRELGFVEVQAARRPTATGWLQRAAELAETDAERAPTEAIHAMSVADTGHHREAVAMFDQSIERSRRAGDVRQQAWSLGVKTRSLMLLGDDSAAALAADESIELCRSQQWMAFLPWPRTFRGELYLRAGDVHAARAEIEAAWSVSCHLGDPCWEGVAARMLGKLCAHTGDLTGGLMWLDEAMRRCDVASDTNQWVRCSVLDTWATLAIDAGDVATATRLTAQLEALSGRGEMREFTVHALLHRAALGHPATLGSARLIAESLDNPELHRMCLRLS